MSGIDPVKFGELCSDVKNIRQAVKEIKEGKVSVEKRLKEHGDSIIKIETEKKWIYRVFGSGTLGAAIYQWFF